VTTTEETPRAAVRPDPPLRIRRMIIPLLVGITAMVVGGFTGEMLYGVVWGIVAAAGLLLAFRLGTIEISRSEAMWLSGAIVLSTFLSTRVMPDTPGEVDVLLALGYALAWLPAGGAAGLFAFRRGVRPSTSLSIVATWMGGAALAIPAGSTFDVIHPLEGLRRGEEAVFGGGDYAMTALAIGMFGIAVLLGHVAMLPNLATISIVVFMTAYAGAQVGFTIPGLIENVSNIVNVPNFWPPDFGWAIGGGDWWWIPSWEFGSATRASPMVETFRIAMIAATIGVAVSLPAAFLASTLTAPNRPSFLIDKGFINLIRTVPDLFWAMIFVTSVGPGPFAGALALAFFSLAIMSKLLSETVDGADPGPLEAAKATGSRHFPAVRSAVLPQVLPNYVAYGLYVFEINIRASVVLGLVGAGGIGQVLEAQRAFFRFDRVLAVVILIFVIVFVIEQISIALRRRLV
jgi:phosphonate transport system permease protein